MGVPFYGDYDLTETVNIPFNTFTSDDPSASCTITDLVAGDVYVHKDGVEGTPTGITVSLNVGAVNGNHLAILDLTDTNDPGFYANGARYQVRIEGTTVDGATINAWIGAFSIGCTLRPTTSGRTLDIQTTGEVDANMTMILGHLLTQTGTQLADGFEKFFDVGAPTGTINSLPGAAADAAGGLPISDAGGLDLDIYLKSGVTLSGTANAGDSTIQITLTGGVATDNYYNGQLVIITGGTGAGQARTVLSYLAAGTVATPTRDWAVAPDGTSTFVVIGADVAGILEAGKAAAGSATSITFDATASTTVNIYKNNFVMLTGGTGVGQTRLISAYSAGRVATVTPAWTTNPDATSIYQVLPMARVDVAGWLGNLVTGDGDWAALKAETALIVEDTGELQTNQGNWATATGFAVAGDQMNLVDDAITAGKYDQSTAYPLTASDGSGLIALAWNSAWDAEVQSECTDALNAYDPPTKAELDAGLAALNNLSAADVNAQVVDVINVDVLVAGVTIAESLRRIGAITSGKVSGAKTGTETWKDYAESVHTIVVTVDGSGNRSAIVYN